MRLRFDTMYMYYELGQIDYDVKLSLSDCRRGSTRWIYPGAARMQTMLRTYVKHHW